MLTFAAGAASINANSADPLALYLLEREGGLASIRTGLLFAAIVPDPVVETTPEASTAPDYPKHKVQRNENDWTIAKKYDITVKQLQKVNPGVVWTKLQIGQSLNLPVGTEPIGYIPSIRTSRARIATNNVRIRSKPSTDSRVKTTVGKGTVTTVLNRKGSWYLLRFPRGTEGWVRGDLLKPIADPVQPKMTPVSYVPPKPVNGNISSSIINLSLDQLGIRYKWGGTSPRGFDCSGLLFYCFAKNGISLPRTSLAMSRIGDYVSKSDLQPGDLVFYRTGRSRRVNHVVMFIGDGKFIHSSSYEHKVVIRNMADYKSTFAGARRIPGLQIDTTAMELAIADLETDEKTDEKTRVVIGADKIGK